ncbi:hypothetical protein BsWGS_11013 [Bradybaena similaris]
MNEYAQTHNKYGVLFGPIYKGKNADQLATHVFKMLLTLGVRCSDISCVFINTKVGYAKIEVCKSECEDYLVKVLPEVKSIMSLFNLRLLLENPKHVKVARIRQVGRTSSFQEISDGGISAYRPVKGESLPQLLRAMQPGLAAADDRANTRHETTAKTPVNILNKSSETTSSLQVEFEELVEEDESRILRHESTSVSDILSSTNEHQLERQFRSDSSHKPVMLHKKTSTPSGLPCDCPNTVFYRRLQRVGSETRYSEFKKGGVIYNQNSFTITIAKYVCGFLNSEGGTIFFGVSDDGIVRGLTIDTELEKTLRLDIDFAIESIKPGVDKCEYTINFARVMEEDGAFSPDLKVLEVCVKPRQPEGVRYSHNGIAYVRRDGSLQKVKMTQ